MWTPQQFEAVMREYPAPISAKRHREVWDVDAACKHYCVGQALMATAGLYYFFPGERLLADFLASQAPGDALATAEAITSLNDRENFTSAWKVARRFLTGQA